VIQQSEAGSVDTKTQTEINVIVDGSHITCILTGISKMTKACLGDLFAIPIFQKYPKKVT